MKNWKQAVAWIACFGMITPHIVFAETHSTPAAAFRDIALGANNSLAGQVLDAQGQAIADATVTIASSDQSILQTKSDDRGYFQVSGLKGGIYQVNCLNNQGLYRLWADRTAPPAATAGLLIVQDDVMRGQCATNCSDGCNAGVGPGYVPGNGYPVVGGQGGFVPGAGAGNGMLGLLANPWVIGAAVAVAVAVPLALDDDAS